MVTPQEWERLSSDLFAAANWAREQAQSAAGRREHRKAEELRPLYGQMLWDALEIQEDAMGWVRAWRKGLNAAIAEIEEAQDD